MAKIIIIKLNNFCNVNEFKFLDFLSNERCELIYRYRSYKDAYRSYIGALLIRYAVSEYVMCRNSELIFNYNLYGKPFLLNYKNCFFNLSHSGKYVLCIVDEDECGIDIEQIGLLDINIAKNFFHKNEYSRIKNFNNISDSTNYFYFVWTMKEAYLKMLGVGLSKQLSSFSVEKDLYGKIIISDKEMDITRPIFSNSRVIEDEYYISSTSFSKPKYIYINDCDFLDIIKQSVYFN